ncbi:MAG: ABC transporter ATP-binding protein [Oscillatoria princeps RMCB-10]|jgi:ABC-2 type transport system ATP-binding protein|nr:ABC transporter ATP-binding protein [Oscillatoria princeps RMCB-10]
MIEVEHLSKSYGSTPAIIDVTFAVEPGEILGFLGPNGAGKTTTMRILAGYLPATGGTARVAGFDVHENSMAVRQRIGYLPETPPLYPEMTVEGFLHFVARLKRVPAGDRQERVEYALKRCNLLEKRKVLIRKLSKGFRQRVGIAQAIVHDPPAIILDEPTTGLDPRQIIDARNLIKSLAGDHTIILSTHILPEVSMTCSRVVIINRGLVVATDTPENLMAQLASGSRYELEVDGDAAVALQLLEKVPGVISVDLMPAENLPEHRHRLRLTAGPTAEPAPEIVAALVSAGLGLYQMRPVQASLEDVFLEVTTEEKTLALEKTSGFQPEKTPAAELPSGFQPEKTPAAELPSGEESEKTPATQSVSGEHSEKTPAPQSVSGEQEEESKQVGSSSGATAEENPFQIESETLESAPTWVGVNDQRPVYEDVDLESDLWASDVKDESQKSHNN